MFKSYYGDPTPFTDKDGLKRYSFEDFHGSWPVLRPRPEFDAIPVNNVLQEFREEYRWVNNWEAFMDEWIEWVSEPAHVKRIWGAQGVSDEEVEHARRVLTRLRALR